ncbi:MAG: hypothetical protein M3Q39_00990 [Actinomycetota bacterium]|nr:hypothetical protein [Actinomycetota bacterium]
MPLPKTPKIVYNAVALLFTFPARPWGSGSVGIGAGKEESAAGVPSVWVTRREYPLRVPLRFYESEWPAVRAWLVWAMDGGGSFSFYPDQADATVYTCYLKSPGPADEIQPVRGEYPGMMELEVVLRRTTSAAVDFVFYG